jgi:hypothetical protein
VLLAKRTGVQKVKLMSILVEVFQRISLVKGERISGLSVNINPRNLNIETGLREALEVAGSRTASPAKKIKNFDFPHD